MQLCRPFAVLLYISEFDHAHPEVPALVLQAPRKGYNIIFHLADIGGHGACRIDHEGQIHVFLISKGELVPQPVSIFIQRFRVQFHLDSIVCTIPVDLKQTIPIVADLRIHIIHTLPVGHLLFGGECQRRQILIGLFVIISVLRRDRDHTLCNPVLSCFKRINIVYCLSFPAVSPVNAHQGAADRHIFPAACRCCRHRHFYCFGISFRCLLCIDRCRQTRCRKNPCSNSQRSQQANQPFHTKTHLHTITSNCSGTASRFSFSRILIQTPAFCAGAVWWSSDSCS